MKEPRLSDLRVDEKGTKLVRRKMAVSKSIKITINIDRNILAILRSKAAETGVPYQRLLNRVLKEALLKSRDSASRLDRLEREVETLKKRIVA